MKYFIPKPYKKQPITVRIDSDYLNIIDKILEEDRRLTRSEIINQCITFALDNLDWDKLVNNAEISDKQSL